MIFILGLTKSVVKRERKKLLKANFLWKGTTTTSSVMYPVTLRCSWLALSLIIFYWRASSSDKPLLYFFWNFTWNRLMNCNVAEMLVEADGIQSHQSFKTYFVFCYQLKFAIWCKKNFINFFQQQWKLKFIIKYLKCKEDDFGFLEFQCSHMRIMAMFPKQSRLLADANTLWKIFKICNFIRSEKFTLSLRWKQNMCGIKMNLKTQQQLKVFSLFSLLCPRGSWTEIKKSIWFSLLSESKYLPWISLCP